MKAFSKFVFLAAIAAALLAPAISHAQLTFTVENAGIQSSPVPGVTTEDFNSLPLGAFSGGTAVGTFSSGGAIVPPDGQGGAYATDYFEGGRVGDTFQSTITFNTPEDYVGFWWAAGVAGDEIVLLDGTTVIGDYQSADFIYHFTTGYFYNTNYAKSEGSVLGGGPYAYLDFTATNGTQITSMEILSSTESSGFRMDNLSVLDQAIKPPGHAILPDSGSTLLLVGMAASGLMALRKKFAGKS